jgi:hypothetical protein
VARRRIREGTLDQFYDRMARMKQRGAGQFLTRDQIEARSGLTVPLLLQTLPGVWATPGGRSVQMLNPSAMGGIFCNPEIFIDGQPRPIPIREIWTLDLEGVEVYRGYSEAVPGIFPNRCGQIFLWRTSDWGNPFTWRRTFFALGLGGILLGLAALLF